MQIRPLSPQLPPNLTVSIAAAESSPSQGDGYLLLEDPNAGERGPFETNPAGLVELGGSAQLDSASSKIARFSGLRRSRLSMGAPFVAIVVKPRKNLVCFVHVVMFEAK